MVYTEGFYAVNAFGFWRLLRLTRRSYRRRKGRKQPRVGITYSASVKIEVCGQGLGRERKNTSRRLLPCSNPAVMVLFWLQLSLIRSSSKQREGGKLEGNPRVKDPSRLGAIEDCELRPEGSPHWDVLHATHRPASK